MSICPIKSSDHPIPSVATRSPSASGRVKAKASPVPARRRKSASATRASPAPAKVQAALTLPEALAGLPVPSGTRDRILFSAVTVLFEEGFSSLTQQRVCECAGIRQSHLTYYFPTRNDLLREAAAFGCEAMFNQITEGIEAGVVTLDNLRVALNADITDRRWARLMNALIAASDEDARIKPWLAAFDEQIRGRLLADLQRLGLRVSETDVEMLHATFIGAIQMDLGESTTTSLARAQRVIGQALDQLLLNSTARKPPVSGKAGRRRPS